eukprot:Gb_01970 [translate_table: standard]
MAENQRVHPSTDVENEAKVNPSGDVKEKSRPPPSGTYIVRLPKDQIYRVPPPQGSKPAAYSKPPRRCSRFCCCLAWLLGLILSFIVVLVIAAVVLYIVFRPRIPKYSVESIDIKRFNFSKDLSLNSELDLTIRARNPNKKIGIYYGENSRLEVFYSGIKLSSGKIPAFYQGHRNTTVLKAKLQGSNVRFPRETHSSLKTQQTQGSIPLRIKINVPVKIKVGSLKTPKITVRIRCNLAVNKLSANESARIESKSCKVKV